MKFKRRKHLRLGDAVHTVAQPIARVLDATLGTALATCGACARRRATLNSLLPDPFSGPLAPPAPTPRDTSAESP